MRGLNLQHGCLVQERLDSLIDNQITDTLFEYNITSLYIFVSHAVYQLVIL